MRGSRYEPRTEARDETRGTTASQLMRERGPRPRNGGCGRCRGCCTMRRRTFGGRSRGERWRKTVDLARLWGRRRARRHHRYQHVLHLRSVLQPQSGVVPCRKDQAGTQSRLIESHECPTRRRLPSSRAIRAVIFRLRARRRLMQPRRNRRTQGRRRTSANPLSDSPSHGPLGRRPLRPAGHRRRLAD
jgi:hypothetical protein